MQTTWRKTVHLSHAHLHVKRLVSKLVSTFSRQTLRCFTVYQNQSDWGFKCVVWVTYTIKKKEWGINRGYCLCPLDGKITLWILPSSVSIGDKVVLYCQYQTGNYNKTTFFKNGVEIGTYSSFSSESVINMTIENVTQQDEGLYKCASQDGKLKSPEIQLSVRHDQG